MANEFVCLNLALSYVLVRGLCLEEGTAVAGFDLTGSNVSRDAQTELTRESIREAVGVFHRPEDLQSAIDELLSSGFHRAELSLLASAHAVESKLARRYDKVQDLQDDPRVPRAAYVSTEAIGDAQGGIIGALAYIGATVASGAIVASGGTLAAAIVAAVLTGGAGGLAGSILAKWLGDHHANLLQEQIAKGGLLLWVRTWTPADETRAMEILSRHAASHAHVHDLPAPTGGSHPAWTGVERHAAKGL